MKLVTITMILFLAACTRASEIHLADGSEGYQISCHGAAQTMMDCFRRAGEECPQGFALWNGANEGQSFGTEYGTGSRKYPDWVAYGMTTNRRSILVKCQ